MRIYKDTEIDWFRCAHSIYRTFRERDLAQHVLRHKNPENVKLFLCDLVGTTRQFEMGMQRYLLLHKNHKQVKLHQCNHHKYKTIHIKGLKDHS